MSAIDLLNRVVQLVTPKNPITTEVNGNQYRVNYDGTLGIVIKPEDLRPAKAIMYTQTLTGLIDAFKADYDKLSAARVAVFISAYNEVQVFSLDTDEFGKSRVFLYTKHKDETKFQFDEYYEPEDFILAFRSSFYLTEQAINVQKLASSVTSGQSVAVADDGISQAVTIKVGEVTKAPITLPAEGVPLVPWRTFREVPPVESKFLLRMKAEKDSLPEIALFEIDAKWQVDTIGAVRKYLTEQLPTGTVIIG